jgi:hypothetical protein
MLKESETLLQIIERDEEISRSGSLDHLELAEAVKDGKDRENYRQAMIELSKYFDQMSTAAFLRLMQFADTSEINTDKELGWGIREKYSSITRSDSETEYKDNIAKRALFLQTFSNDRTDLYSIFELDQETEVKKYHPWEWIDAVKKVDIATAVDEIITQVKIEQDIQQFAWRVSYFATEVVQGKKYLDQITNAIKGKIPEKEYDSLTRLISDSLAAKEERQ